MSSLPWLKVSTILFLCFVHGLKCFSFMFTTLFFILCQDVQYLVITLLYCINAVMLFLINTGVLNQGRAISTLDSGRHGKTRSDGQALFLV